MNRRVRIMRLVAAAALGLPAGYGLAQAGYSGAEGTPAPLEQHVAPFPPDEAKALALEDGGLANSEPQPIDPADFPPLPGDERDQFPSEPPPDKLLQMCAELAPDNPACKLAAEAASRQ